MTRTDKCFMSLTGVYTLKLITTAQWYQLA